MATNPDLAVKAVEVTPAQLDTLAGGGSLTSGNDTYTANTATLYLTEDDSVVVTDTAPTSSTVGYIGQFRLITTSGSEALYICTAANSTYSWKQVTLT